MYGLAFVRLATAIIGARRALANCGKMFFLQKTLLPLVLSTSYYSYVEKNVVCSILEIKLKTVGQLPSSPPLGQAKIVAEEGHRIPS